MKKKSLYLVCLLMFVSCIVFFTIESYAIENPNEIILLEKEKIAVKKILDESGYGSFDASVDILFDGNGMPSYLLGVTDEGYMILRRYTFELCEAGEFNPYSKWMDFDKFYGGPLCYFAKLIKQTDESALFDDNDREYYDIVKNCETNSVYELEYHHGVENKIGDQLSVETNNTSSIIEKRLTKSDEYIRQKAYGYNADKKCSAVATGIALNYIARRHNIAIVPADFLAEKLITGSSTNSENVSSNYKNVKRLFDYIVNDCGMGDASFGSKIENSIIKYTNNKIPCISAPVLKNYKYNFSLNCLNNSFSSIYTIEDQIDLDHPVLVTTTLTTSTSIDDYAFHTMCVYGYKKQNGITTYLVHTGWYVDVDKTASGQYYQRLVYLPEGYFTYKYYFSFESPLKNYSDVDNYSQNTNYAPILYVVKEGLMTGTSSNKFSPNDDLTRAMFVTILYRLSGKPNVSYVDCFWDIPSNVWYSDPVIWAYKNGIANGTGSETKSGTTKLIFDPNGKLSRENLVTFLYRYARCKGYPINGAKSIAGFYDSNNVASYATEAMKWAYGNGIIIGNNGYLNPKGTASRVQTAIIIMRFVQKFGKK